MLSVLINSILPVFAILALGFLMGRTKTASVDEARALNRISFLVLQPALIFPLMATADFAQFDLMAIAVYALCEVIAFLIGFWVARHVFKRERLEAFLLGMSVVFVNSLLYIWPISYLIYGEIAALPITAIVAWDASISFGFFIIAMELMTRGQSEVSATRRIAGNPILISIVAGALISAMGLSVAAPILTFTDFAGKAAAPCTLFALGVILSQAALKPSGTVIGFAALKLLLFPALVWGGMTLFSPDNAWTPLFSLNAAGPSGAMAFSLALLYGVRTDAIAQVIIWTSVLSLVSLAYLA